MQRIDRESGAPGAPARGEAAGLGRTPATGRRRRSRAIVSRQEAFAIVTRIASESGVAIDDLLGEGSARAFCQARQRVYLEIRRAGASYRRIGLLMQRSHAAILHGVRRAEARELAGRGAR
jgi:chromosomal replication initiation ATPase DnaA